MGDLSDALRSVTDQKFRGLAHEAADEIERLQEAVGGYIAGKMVAENPTICRAMANFYTKRAEVLERERKG